MTERATQRPPAPIDVQERVIAVVASIVGSRRVERDASWRSLGLDSLDLLSLVTSIEEEFDLRIDDEAAMRLRTVLDVVDLVLNAGA